MSARNSDRCSILVMIAALLWVYCPLGLLGGEETLFGIDALTLHEQRLRLAHSELMSHGRLPAWNPVEFLGAPFRANLQSFPWIPNHLLLLLVDPGLAMAVGTNLNAILAALLTFFYGRRVGLGGPAAAAAGWTFASAGFFASRVFAGHLPLLEAYVGLPLLLWLIERAADPTIEPAALRWRHLHLACGAAALCLAGHPQLPLYALITAAAYALWRLRGAGGRRLLATLCLGAALSFWAWWPQLDLILRSTRLLDLAPFGNDVALSLTRLKGFVVPWWDGSPTLLGVGKAHPRTHEFWDTVCYVGLLPLAALVGLLRVRLRGSAPLRFLLGAGAVALLLALSWTQSLPSPTGGTLLRSPARLLYVTTFALSFCLGAGIEVLLVRRSRTALLVFVLLVQVFDLGLHSRRFVRLTPRGGLPLPTQVAGLLEWEPGTLALAPGLNVSLDPRRPRLGTFDSLILARPFLALVQVGVQPAVATQVVDATDFPAEALEALGVHWLLGFHPRADLEAAFEGQGLFLYRVPQPASQARYWPLADVSFVADEGALHALLEARGVGGLRELVLVGERPTAASAGQTAGSVALQRPGPDRIELTVVAESPGYVRLLEAWDPGWSATRAGERVPVMAGNGFLITLPVEPGEQRITLEYHTPGAGLGALLSVLAALGLVVLLRSRVAT